MKKVKYILIYLLTLILYSCSKSGHLIKDYYYLSSDEVSDIGYPYGTTIYQTKHENSFEKILITSDIQNVDVLGDYILVIQSPNLEKFKIQVQDLFSIPVDVDSSFISVNNMNIDERQELTRSINILKSKNTHSTDTLKRTTDSLFIHSNHLPNYIKQRHYFILDTSRDILSKAMDLQTFKKECKLKDIDFEDFIK